MKTEGTMIKLSGILCGKDGKEKLTDLLDRAWNTGTETLTVDLSDVDEMDFDALTTLLSTRNKFAGAGGRMTLSAIPPRLSRIANIFGIKLGKGD